MEIKPLVSVLMTVYNREKYIADAIESVMLSTYSNWELIIVDDRSKDKSVDIAKSYELKDERIKVYVNDQNLGDYPNRNKAASYAKGKYVKYVDADDMIYEHTLGYMVAMMERFSDAGWATFSFKQNSNQPHPYLLSTSEQYRGQYIKGFGYFLRSPLSTIIKTEVFRKENGFKERKMVGDFEMWHRLALKYKLLVLPHSHGFVWYRTHDDQQSFEINEFEGQYRAISLSYINNSECTLSIQEKNKALQNIKKRYLKRVLKLILRGNFKQLKYI